jgi:hypothetical protein
MRSTSFTLSLAAVAIWATNALATPIAVANAGDSVSELNERFTADQALEQLKKTGPNDITITLQSDSTAVISSRSSSTIERRDLGVQYCLTLAGPGILAAGSCAQNIIEYLRSTPWICEADQSYYDIVCGDVHFRISNASGGTRCNQGPTLAGFANNMVATSLFTCGGHGIGATDSVIANQFYYFYSGNA